MESQAPPNVMPRVAIASYAPVSLVLSPSFNPSLMLYSTRKPNGKDDDGTRCAWRRSGVPKEVFAIAGRGRTYDVRSDLAASDSVHSNHLVGFGRIRSCRTDDGASMDGGSWRWISVGCR